MPASAPAPLPTPLPPTPRAVRFRAGRRAAQWGSRLVPLMILLASVGLTGVAVRRPVVMVLGSRIHAVVTDITESRGRHNQITHHVRYTYQVGASEHADRQKVSRAIRDQVRVGETLPGRTLEVAGWRTSDLELASGDTVGVGSMAAVFGAFALAAMYTGWVTPRQLRRVVQTGTPTLGVVTDKHVKKHKQSRTYYLLVGFEPLGASPVTIRQKVGRQVHDAAEPGTPVTVLYDPAKPKRAVAYEYGDWEVVGASHAPSS